MISEVEVVQENYIKKYFKRFFLILLTTLLLCVLIGEFNLYLISSLFFFLFNLFSLIRNMNTEIPIRDLFGVLFGLQYLLGPALVYNVFFKYQLNSYRMRIPQEQYFAFVLPSMILFYLGLWLVARKSKIKLNITELRSRIDNMENTAYVLLGIGFFSSLLNAFIPSSLAFVLYLLTGFKYCGVLMLLLRTKKVPVMIIIAVFGALILSAFSQAMFQDMLIWLVFLGIFCSARFNWTMTFKVFGLLVFLGLIIFLQTIKVGLRQQIWTQGKKFDSEVLRDVTANLKTEQYGVLSKAGIGPQMVRFNQGWIVSSIINHVPQKVPHTYGELTRKYIEAAFLPRFIAKNKLNAGDKQIFNKYSGHHIDEGTSMAISPLGDAYIEFGKVGGMLYFFVFAIVYGLAIRFYSKSATRNVVCLIFVPLIFIYPIRPDCETQTSFGHLIKAGFLVWVFLQTLFKNSTTEEITNLT